MKKITWLFVSLLIVLAIYVSSATAESITPTYPIDSVVLTTLQETVVPDTKFSVPGTIHLYDVSKYGDNGYGNWTFGDPLESVTRTDIMPALYDASAVTKKAKLLNFFTITDIHITDKESPSQLIYLQQLIYPSKGKAPWSFVTSIYSPIMLYTTHVFDSAVQTET